MPSIDNANVVINNLILTEQTDAPATPPTGKWRLYVKADGLYLVDDEGTEAGPFTEGFANPMTTAGDLILGGASGAPGRLAIGTSGQVLTSNGTTAAWSASTDTLGNYILIREEQTAGTNGGTFTAGAWRTRTLNTESVDTGNHASISSNQVTLAAGTYRFRGRAAGISVRSHKLQLYNISDSASVAVGSSEFSIDSTSVTTWAEVSGRFTIAGSKVFELQHYCSTTKTNNGFGEPCNFGVVEVYATLEFWREP